MAGNIPGTNGVALPGAYSLVETQSRGASVPGGIRIAAMIGEGSKSEVLISAALGGGKDGLNPTYTSSTGSDGRHFKFTSFPAISNRFSLFRNGLPLTGLEETPDSEDFPNSYDYRVDITTGQIELQKAFLVDQGGDGYVAKSSNVGDGYLSGLELVDDNAPTETWTIKCISVQRTPLNVPIASTAKFIAFGSVSGQKLDANGNPIIWVANGQTVDNDILEFAIWESDSGATPFREGDSFTVKVKSGVLNKNDTLTATYIPELFLNDPEFLQTPDDVQKKHGLASTDNNLSLGCQLAFANGTPGVMCVQAAPSVPRRTSYVLSDGVKADSTNNDDFIFPLPLGVAPDLNSQIHFFVTNPTTNVETQILPNKFTFYQLDESGQPTTSTFIQDDTLAPSGYSFSYTVVSKPASVISGLDGYIARPANGNNGIFETDSEEFNSDQVGLVLKIIDANNVANNGSFTITSVSEGKLYFSQTTFSDFDNETGIDFELVDPTTGLAVASSNATDGALTKIVSTGTGTFTSSTVDFSDFLPLIGSKRLRISGTDTNDGLYDITAYSSGPNQLTIAKAFVEETGLRYEILDSDQESNYVVINHNVVPDGNQLRVTIVDSRDASFYDAGWLNALESLESQECDIVVPLPKQTISVIFQNALNHCKTMSNIKLRKERVLFCGAINGLTPDNLTGAKSAAVEDIGVLEGIQGDDVNEILTANIEDLTNYSVVDAFGNTYRCVYFYPDQIVVQAGTENVLIDGFYIAAAAAGYLSGIGNVAIPLTNKTLAGFTILRNRQFSPTVMEQLVQAGVTVLKPVAGGGKVVWGLTTTQSGFVEEQEISIVFIRDRIAKTMRAGFEGFVGNAENDFTIATMSARAVSMLNSFVSQGLITAFKDVNVVRDSVDPTQFNVSCKVQPTYPVNFVLIKVSVGLL